MSGKLLVPKGYQSNQQPTVKDALSELNPVKILHFHGDLKSAETADGHTVTRKDGIYVDQEYGVVKCAPYDNHFIFRDPEFEKHVGRWMLMCSCGSPAVIVGANVYRKDASPTTGDESTHPGQLIVCWYHQTYGKHSDGSS